MPSNNAAQLRGLLHPFQRDRRSDFVSGTGDALIRATVAQILGTACASEFTPGEIPWRTDLGSLLGLLRHRRNDAVLQELARVYVVDALKRWEPRIRVTSVQITRERDRSENVLAIRLRYGIAASGMAGGTSGEIEQTVAVPAAGGGAALASGSIRTPVVARMTGDVSANTANAWSAHQPARGSTTRMESARCGKRRDWR